MARTAQIGDGAVPSDDSKQVELMIGLARDEMAEAFRTADALETKARSVQQLATVFFAAGQAAAGVLVASGAKAAPTGVAIAAGVLAILSLLAVAVGALLTAKLQEPADQKTLDIKALEGKLFGYAEKSDSRVPRFIYGELAEIVDHRRGKNKTKAEKVDTVQWAAYAAVVFAATELALSVIYTFIAR